MSENNIPDDKRSLLIEAAIKRFSHFGISKTTLSEIAEDVHISKANLYYYFPDKWALIEAIVDEMINESLGNFEIFLQNAPHTEQALTRILDSKMEYLQKYRLLIRDLNEVNVHEIRFKAMGERLFEVERQMVVRVLEQGIKKKEIETIDIEEVSKLYVTAMRGLALYKIYSDPSPIVDEVSIEVVAKQQKLLNHIFCMGIKRI